MRFVSEYEARPLISAARMAAEKHLLLLYETRAKRHKPGRWSWPTPCDICDPLRDLESNTHTGVSTPTINGSSGTFSITHLVVSQEYHALQAARLGGGVLIRPAREVTSAQANYHSQTFRCQGQNFTLLWMVAGKTAQKPARGNK